MRSGKTKYVLVTFSIAIILIVKQLGWPLHKKLFNSPRLNLTIVISNRVPKCGSHLTREVFYDLSVATNAYTSENSMNHLECRLNSTEQKKLYEELINKTKIAQHQRFVYDRHFHFVNFEADNYIKFYYINQLRDPIDQLVSGYYYNRYVCMVTSPQNICEHYAPSIYNLTLDECVLAENPDRCLRKSYGAPEYLIYFCGQDSICDNDSPNYDSSIALSLAKKNIEKYYLYVGLLEYIENSYEILERLLPDMFTGILKVYERKQNEPRITSVPLEYRRPPSNETKDKLRQLLIAEYDLYNFVRQRFVLLYQNTFNRPPRSFKNTRTEE